MVRTQSKKGYGFVMLGALFGLLGVLLGAFGAHALKSAISEGDLQIFETAVRYQMYHSLLLVLLGGIWGQSQSEPVARWLRISGISTSLGIGVFSGSLYILVLTQARWLGAVTPIGGLSLMVGWLALAIAGRRLVLAR